jgi:23S rRNA (pseudouridine1915-N3)-methyltransferase
MKIRVLACGRLKRGPERDLVEEYISRAEAAAPRLGFRGITAIEVEAGGGLEAEGVRLLAKLPEGALAIRLDEAGENLTSAAFAGRLARWRDQGTGELVFLIGGAEGYADEVRRAVPLSIAYGVQTWPHRLVRVMLAEQIYRAMTILAGTPYHKH